MLNTETLKMKHGQDTLRVTRMLGDLSTRLNRNVSAVTTSLPNEGSYLSIKTSLISLPYRAKKVENVICSLKTL